MHHDFLLYCGCQELVETPWQVKILNIRHIEQIVMYVVIDPD